VPPGDKPFHEQLKEHLERGTRAGAAARKWKHQDFALEARVDARALTNYKSGERTPPREVMERFATLLFAGDAPERADFVAAWEKADAGKRRGARPPTPGPDWVAEQPFALDPALARLYVHQSPNEAPSETVALAVTAETGRIYLTIEKTEDTPRVDTTFAVSRAEIVVIKDMNVLPVKGTELGTAKKPHPNVTFATSWHLRVPLDTEGVPGGGVLDQEVLRQYSTHAGLPYGIRIELRCRDIDLKPIDDKVLPEVSEKQRAVLRRLLQADQGRPDSGMVTLARAELCGRRDP
jgi:hypothetical protein